MSLDSILRATGKNLFDINSVTGFVNSSGNIMSENNMKIQNGSIISNYGLYGQSCMTKEYVYLPVGTYTISADVLIDNANANPVYIGLYELDKKINLNKPTTIPLNQTTRVSATVNVVKNGNYHILTQGSGKASQYTNLNAVFSNIQLEKGSTATTYEPYEYLGPKTIKMSSNSKNLIPYPYATTSKTISGVTFTVQEDGGIKVEGTPNKPVSMFYISTPANTISALKIGNTYTLSGYRSGNGATLFYKNTEISDYYTFTCDAQNPLIGIKVVQGTTADALFYPQLEEGSVATDYELNTGSKEVLKVSYNSKNFFNINNIYNPLNTDTYEISNNTLKVYRNRSYIPGVIYHISLPVGTQYTVHYDIEYGGTATGVYNCADDKIFQGRLNHVNYTGTIGDTGYLKLEFSRIGGDNDKLGWVTYSNIQVELGNKKTEYVPYFNTVVWTQVLTGYNITSTTNADGTQSLNIVDATSTTDHYNITSTDNSDGTQTLNITDA